MKLRYLAVYVCCLLVVAHCDCRAYAKAKPKPKPELRKVRCMDACPRCDEVTRILRISRVSMSHSNETTVPGSLAFPKCYYSDGTMDYGDRVIANPPQCSFAKTVSIIHWKPKE